MGANCVHMAIDAHDRAVAYTSHAPQVLASALAVLAARAGAGVAAGPAFPRDDPQRRRSRVDVERHLLGERRRGVRRAARTGSSELDTVASGLEASPIDTSSALTLLAEARALR